MTLEYYSDQLKKEVIKTRSKYFTLDKDEKSAKPVQNKWSKKEILGHLIDSARINLQRFTEIIASGSIYTLKSYDQNHLVRTLRYQDMDDFELLTLWQLLNNRIATVWSNTDVGHLEKQLISDGKPYTLDWLINDYLDHLRHHLGQIFPKENDNRVPAKVSLIQAVEKLKNQLKETPAEFVSMLRYADIEVEYYKPDKKDKQKPHLKDEVYVISSGRGMFYSGGQTMTFNTGDVIFVKAGDDHRFTDFSDDFATWVIFFGIKNPL